MGPLSTRAATNNPAGAEAVEDLALLEGGNFLAKPSGPAKLLHMVRDCLDRYPQPA